MTLLDTSQILGPNFPEPLHNHGLAAVDDGRIFVIGGRVKESPATNQLMTITMEKKKKWDTKMCPPMREKKSSRSCGDR